MSEFPTRRSMEFTLAANEEMAVNVSGEFLGIINATGAFDVSFDDQPFLASGRGFGYPGGVGPSGARARFGRLRFKDTSGATNEISIVWGNGEVIDNRAIFGGASVPVAFDGPQPVTQSGAFLVDQATPDDWRTPSPEVYTTLTTATLPPASAYLILGASATRSRAMISNRGTETVWIKSGAAVLGNGLPLAPGETTIVKTRADVYAANLSAVTVPLTMQEEAWA